MEVARKAKLAKWKRFVGGAIPVGHQPVQKEQLAHPYPLLLGADHSD